MNIVCVKDLQLPRKSNSVFRTRFTAGKTYQVVHENEQSIQIFDDNDAAVVLHKERIKFNYHFKYIQEVRSDKLELLGI